MAWEIVRHKHDTTNHAFDPDTQKTACDLSRELQPVAGKYSTKHPGSCSVCNAAITPVPVADEQSGSAKSEDSGTDESDA